MPLFQKPKNKLNRSMVLNGMVGDRSDLMMNFPHLTMKAGC